MITSCSLFPFFPLLLSEKDSWQWYSLLMFLVFLYIRRTNGNVFTVYYSFWERCIFSLKRWLEVVSASSSTSSSYPSKRERKWDGTAKFCWFLQYFLSIHPHWNFPKVFFCWAMNDKEPAAGAMDASCHSPSKTWSAVRWIWIRTSSAVSYQKDSSILVRWRVSKGSYNSRAGKAIASFLCYTGCNLF